MTLKSSSGTSYKLDSTPIGTGGEGEVYFAYITKIAKIYKPGVVTKELENKLKIMIENPPSEAVLSQVAWPTDIVYGEDGKCAGFIMPKLSINAELGEVYRYPAVLPISIHQKINIAQNICVVISEVHKAGYVFGDFNPRNIGLDTNTGLVSFLDTDTYHVVDPSSNETYRCNVCAPGYAAPELLESCSDYIAANPSASKNAYASAPLPTFTQDTDNFALAIHIFKLLMNGYTPFGGIIESASVSQSSPGVGDTAVRRDNYCFKEGFKHQSAAIIPLEAFPEEIADLFTRAFITGKKEPGKRPTAAEWHIALDEYLKTLLTCADNDLHQYDAKNADCPYCEADAKFCAAIAKDAPKTPALKQTTYTAPPPKTAPKQQSPPQKKQAGAAPMPAQTAPQSAATSTPPTGKTIFRHQNSYTQQANQQIVTLKKNPVLSAGMEHSLAIDRHGNLLAWGSNKYGQLGAVTLFSSQKDTVHVLSSVIGVSAGGLHSMAITGDNNLWAWGANDAGQLGNGSFSNSFDPEVVLEDVMAVSAGGSHTLAITKKKALYAWGSNEFGQLGTGSFANASAPVFIMYDVTAIAAGLHESAAITTDGSLYVWGYPNELDNGSMALTPTLLPELNNVVAVSLGNTHSMAITTNGDLYTWGDNDFGQLGNGSLKQSLSPVKIMTNVIYVSARGHHSMAITAKGNLLAWGKNTHGQLGDGTTANRTSPTLIMQDVTAVAAGENHTIAALKSRDLYEWGSKTSGILGKGKVLLPNYVMGNMMT